MEIEEAKQSIVEAGKKLVDSGLISRTWGNISCRIDDKFMAITPSGMDYNLITTEDVVVVSLSDLSFSGNRKPSMEKGIHASCYKLHPEVNFVIHTHQVNASVVAALGLKKVEAGDKYPLLKGEVLCAEYALPGSKALCKNVSECVKIAKGHAVLMAYHGALCMGQNQNEAFASASQLEEACAEFVKSYYIKISGEEHDSENSMRSFALKRAYGEYGKSAEKGLLEYDSERSETGFRLIKGDEKIEVYFNNLGLDLPEDAAIHNVIYKINKDINYIKLVDEPNAKEVSGVGISLRPLLDDFAQIAGTKIKTAEMNPSEIKSALKGQSAVFIRDKGALCLGNTKGDAQAVAMILEKTCKTLIGAALFGQIKPISRIDCFLMRLNYRINYSKALSKVK